jgi:hypothetical protein
VNWNGEPRGWGKRLTVCTARRALKPSLSRGGIGRNDAVVWEEYLSHQLEISTVAGDSVRVRQPNRVRRPREAGIIHSSTLMRVIGPALRSKGEARRPVLPGLVAGLVSHLTGGLGFFLAFRKE